MDEDDILLRHQQKIGAHRAWIDQQQQQWHGSRHSSAGVSPQTLGVQPTPHLVSGVLHHSPEIGSVHPAPVAMAHAGGYSDPGPTPAFDWRWEAKSRTVDDDHDPYAAASTPPAQVKLRHPPSNAASPAPGSSRVKATSSQRPPFESARRVGRCPRDCIYDECAFVVGGAAGRPPPRPHPGGGHHHVEDVLPGAGYSVARAEAGHYSGLSRSPLSVQQRTMMWLRRREQRLEEQRSARPDDDDLECTFHPSISSIRGADAGGAATGGVMAVMRRSNRITEARSIEDHVRRQERARQAEREKELRMRCDGSKWTCRRTQPEPFELGRRVPQESIAALRLPVEHRVLKRVAMEVESSAMPANVFAAFGAGRRPGCPQNMRNTPHAPRDASILALASGRRGDSVDASALTRLLHYGPSQPGGVSHGDDTVDSIHGADDGGSDGAGHGHRWSLQTGVPPSDCGIDDVPQLPPPGAFSMKAAQLFPPSLRHRRVPSCDAPRRTRWGSERPSRGSRTDADTSVGGEEGEEGEEGLEDVDVFELSDALEEVEDDDEDLEDSVDSVEPHERSSAATTRGSTLTKRSATSGRSVTSSKRSAAAASSRHSVATSKHGASPASPTRTTAATSHASHRSSSRPVTEDLRDPSTPGGEEELDVEVLVPRSGDDNDGHAVALGEDETDAVPRPQEAPTPDEVAGDGEGVEDVPVETEEPSENASQDVVVAMLVEGADECSTAAESPP